MSFNPAEYPHDWHEIAADVKAAAHHRCQSCDRECQRPGAMPCGETSLVLVDRTKHPTRCEGCTKRSCNWDRALPVLTVHHIDRDTNNSDPLNLVALCPGCHLAAERDAIERETADSLELRLPWMRDASLDVAELRRRILAGVFATHAAVGRRGGRA